MTVEEMQKINDDIHTDLEKRLSALEKRMAEKDTQFAVINTKLSAILWGVGVIGTALCGVLIKLVFGV